MPTRTGARPDRERRRGPGGVPILVRAGHVGLSFKFGTCRGGAFVAVRVDFLGARPRHASTVAVTVLAVCDIISNRGRIEDRDVAATSTSYYLNMIQVRTP